MGVPDRRRGAGAGLAADLIARRAATWGEVLELARQGKVLLPLRPPHSLMIFYTLAANLGTPCAVDGRGDLIDAATGARVIEMMRELAGAGRRRICFDMDPIAVFEAWRQTDRALSARR